MAAGQLDTVEAVAHHEAGHAVMMFVLNFGIKSVIVEGPPLTGRTVPKHNLPVPAPQNVHDALLQRALSGPVAQVLFARAGETLDDAAFLQSVREKTTGQDANGVEVNVEQLIQGNQGSHSRAKAEKEQEYVRIVRERLADQKLWSAVEGIANRLKAQMGTELCGDEAEQIVRDALEL